MVLPGTYCRVTVRSVNGSQEAAPGIPFIYTAPRQFETGAFQVFSGGGTHKTAVSLLRIGFWMADLLPTGPFWSPQKAMQSMNTAFPDTRVGICMRYTQETKKYQAVLS